MRRTLLVLAAVFVVASAPANGQSTSFLNKKMSDWLKELENRDSPAGRRSAAFALGRMGSIAADAVPDLARRVHGDSDALVRDMAASALGDIVLSMKYSSPGRQWDQAGKTLAKALAEDPDTRVRRSAAYALGAFGNMAGAAAPSLRKALRDKSPSVRQNAAWALGRVGAAADAAAVADLCDLLGDANPLVRRDSASALGTLGKSGRRLALKAGKPLLEMVKNEKDEVARKTALGALATLSGPEHAGSAPDLYPLLASKDPETARGAAYVLANMGGEPARRAVPVLQAALTEPDSDVQALAAAALANAGVEALPAVDELARVLAESKDPVVRRNCAIALGHVGPAAKNAIPALAAALKPVAGVPADGARGRPYEEVREMAAEAIAQIRFPGNEAALPIVREVIRKDANQTVRHRCVWALFNIRDLDRYELTRPLADVLEEKSDDSRSARYDAARILAWALAEKAPDKTCDVLLDMISNTSLKVFNRTDATIEGAPDESKGGSSGTAADLGGDARYMAAEALGWMGEKSKKNPAVVAALRKAAVDKEPKLREKALKALETLGLAVKE